MRKSTHSVFLRSCLIASKIGSMKLWRMRERSLLIPSLITTKFTRKRRTTSASSQMKAMITALTLNGRRSRLNKLKPVLKRALLDLKIKGRIDTGDSILNTFLGFFLNEDPKKIILLVDSFCSLAKNLPKKEMINLHFGSDEISEVSLSSGKSLKEEDREKLISLKLQSIDEVIKRSERMKGRKNLNRKKRQPSKPSSKPRLFNNSVLQKKLANETMSNRLKINKFINKETPRRKVSRKNSVL